MSNQPTIYDLHHFGFAVAAWIIAAVCIGFCGIMVERADVKMKDDCAPNAAGISKLVNYGTAWRILCVLFAPVLTYLTLNALFA